jgi:PadR family transcriptional regulator, regulatory protein PadR
LKKTVDTENISQYNIDYRYRQPISGEKMEPLFRDLILGFVKIHILYHADIEPIYGAWMQDELNRHGYDIGPGTLYPMLHALEGAGYLVVEERVVEGRVRKYYSLTEAGRNALSAVREKALELVGEISGESR